MQAISEWNVNIFSDVKCPETLVCVVHFMELLLNSLTVNQIKAGTQTLPLNW